MSFVASAYVKGLMIAPNGEKIQTSQKALLLLLADDHNQDLHKAWPSVGFLAERAGMTDVHCRRLLRALEAMGVIESRLNIRREDYRGKGFGARTTNEYRFCAIDPPFNQKETEEREKILQLQDERRKVRQSQGKLYPNTDVGGPPTSSTGGGKHRCSGDSNTGVRGTQTPVFGLEPLREPLRESLSEQPLEPRNTLPSSGRGSGKAVEEGARFSDLKRELKEYLSSVPRNIAEARGFTTVQPSAGAKATPGSDDYEVCFRDWHLDEVKRMPNGLLIVTYAGDEVAAQAGLLKYAKTLDRLARKHFLRGEKKPVNFKLLPSRARVGDPAGAAAASTEPVRTEGPAGGRTSEFGGQNPAYAQEPAAPADDVWERVKREMELRIADLPFNLQKDFAQNFESAVRHTRLYSAQMTPQAALWKVSSVHVQKTRAVLGLLRKKVLEPALAAVAQRGDVQVQVVETFRRIST